jgi:uncharacterized protein (DUF433 family)
VPEDTYTKHVDGPLITKVEILNGEPVFQGTDVPIKTLHKHIAEGKSVEEFLTMHPQVTRAQVQKAQSVRYPRQQDHTPRQRPLSLFIGNLLLWLAPALLLGAFVVGPVFGRPSFPFIVGSHVVLWPGYFFAAIGDWKSDRRFSSVRLVSVLAFGFLLGILGPVFASADYAARLAQR